MFVALETRWFFPGCIPSEVGDWFDTLGEVQAQPPRIDVYLLGTGQALGVKLRQGRIEMKQLVTDYGESEFAPGLCGNMGSWIKWGFEVVDRQPGLGKDPHWAAVEKTRQILYFRQDQAGNAVRSTPGSLPDVGGRLELTALKLAGQDWWTFGVEVFGPEDGLQFFWHGFWLGWAKNRI